MCVNPYMAGAGRTPAYLAGREQIIANAAQSFETLKAGFPERSVIYYGLRGVGKTVLLNALEDLAEEMDIPSSYMEVSEVEGSFHKAIAITSYKLLHEISKSEKAKSYVKKAFGILKAFSLKYTMGDIDFEIDLDPLKGFADTGNIQNDVKELLLAIGMAAKKEEQGAVIFLDEIQYLQDDDFSALIEAFHRINQKGCPIALYGAGLPKITKIAGDIKSYAERLFSFIEIGSLPTEEAKKALTEPAKRFGITYQEEVLNKIVELTDGYPYFLQEYGNCIWKIKAGQKVITPALFEKAYELIVETLDESFFKVRFDRATAKEAEFMFAMAECRELPCATKEVADFMGESQQSISPIRATLIHKGFIYAPQRGSIDFTVPQFDDYLRRIKHN